MAAEQLDVIDRSSRKALTQRLRIFLSRRDVPPAGPQVVRKSDGQFASSIVTDATIPDAVAAVICTGYFACVCRMMGLDRAVAKGLLAQPPRSYFAKARNKDLMRAIYARQLAMYLASTEANLPQAQIARVTGLDRAGVHKALRSVEDLRDDYPDYEQLIACVLVDVAMNGLQP